MNLLELFYYSIFNYKRTLDAYNMRFWKRLGYLLLLALIISLPFIPPIETVITLWEENRAAVVKSVPEFSVEGDTIEGESDPFINRTDLITYVYHPDKSSNDALSGEEATIVQNAPLSFITNKDAFSVRVFDNELVTFPYDGRRADSDTQRDFIQETTAISHAIIYGAGFLSVFVSTLFDAAILAIILSFMALSRQLSMRFGQKFNFALTAMTLPAVIMAVVAYLFPSFIPIEMPAIFIWGWIRLLNLSRTTRLVSLEALLKSRRENEHKKHAAIDRARDQNEDPDPEDERKQDELGPDDDDK